MAGLPYFARFIGLGIGVRAPKASNPGRCFAGTVEQVGASVADLAPGDDVYGTCEGSFAEYASAPASQVARMPANLSFAQAAAVPISAVTALQGLRDSATVRPSDKVLILGASGGVGTFAVQIAKSFGAEVTGVCSTAKMESVRALGADHVIDYAVDDFADGSDRYDVILDIGGNSSLRRLRRALTPTGTLVIVGGETGGKLLGGFDRSLRAPLLSLVTRQKLTMLASKENAHDLDVVRELIESGRVTPAIDATYPLAETAVAVRALIDGRVRGKVVVTV
jgi:NADPH:quinone reductase-like Zn-dependent oxidoreductase